GVDCDPQRIRVADRAAHPHLPAAEVERDARVAADHVDVCGYMPRGGEPEYDGRCGEKGVRAHTERMDPTGRLCMDCPTGAAAALPMDGELGLKPATDEGAPSNRQRSAEVSPIQESGYDFGIRERGGIAAVGLHPPAARGVHRGEVRVRHHDLVAECLEAAGHPLELSHRLDQDAGSGPAAQLGGEALPVGPDPALDDLAGLRLDADLAIALV